MLCAFDHVDSVAQDLESLPAYVAALVPGTEPFVRTAVNMWENLIDPRVPVAPDNQRRALGFWLPRGGTQFQFEIQLAEESSFNLSLYTHSADVGPHSFTPLVQHEQFGRPVAITVTDRHGTQNLNLDNNAPGLWVTFPVQGDPDHPIQVTFGGTYAPGIAAITFDPYDNHLTTYTYDPTTGNLLTVTDGLGDQVRMTY